MLWFHFQRRFVSISKLWQFGNHTQNKLHVNIFCLSCQNNKQQKDKKTTTNIKKNKTTIKNGWTCFGLRFCRWFCVRKLNLDAAGDGRGPMSLLSYTSTPHLPQPSVVVFGKQLAACNHSADDNVKRRASSVGERHSGGNPRKGLMNCIAFLSTLLSPFGPPLLSWLVLSISLLCFRFSSLSGETKNCTLDHVRIILFVCCYLFRVVVDVVFVC